MRNRMSMLMCLLGVVALVALASPVAQAAEKAEDLERAECPVGPSAEVEKTPVKGKPKPPQCCNPDDEPGVNGNPFCFEGHTCCSDGVWRCNNPDASPSCDPGEVCDTACGGRGDACTVNEDCCSGRCGRKGTCR